LALLTKASQCATVPNTKQMGLQSYYTSAYNRLETNQPNKTYLSVQYGILYNCGSSINIIYQCLTTPVV